MGTSLKGKFDYHKYRAERSGISFMFTFEEWVAFWEASGKLSQRGVGRGKYVMARNGDEGPYSPENVRIILFEENSAERRLNAESRAKIGRASKGRTVSAKTRQLLREKNLGKKQSVETCQKRSKALKGNQNGFGWRPSKEQRNKMTSKLLGNTRRKGLLHSKETKSVMSASQKLRWERVRKGKVNDALLSL